MGGLTNDVRRFWWAVLAIALLTIVTRLPSLLHPQAIDDEETYSVVANVIVDGGRPYVDAVERKPPLLFWTGYVFGWSAQSISGIDTRPWIVPGAWTTLEEDFAKDPPTYVVDVQFPAKNAHYPVRDFPILAGLLAERYRPVAWTSKGVIYQMNSSRGTSEKSAGAENNRSD